VVRRHLRLSELKLPLDHSDADLEAAICRLLGLPAEALRGAVLASWVRKEAAIKWHRGSIAHDLRHWVWDGNRGGLQHLQRGWQPPSVLHLHDGWCCAVVGEAVEQAQWA